MVALAALADVEAWLSLPAGNADEALLTRLLSAASDFAETYCNRQFSVTDYVEVRDGNGQARLSPFQYPITAIAGVTICDQAIPALSGTGGGYFLAGRSIVLRGYVFDRGTANVVLNYSAGFDVIPDAVQQAVIELVAMRYRERDRIGLSSQHAAGETTSYSLKDMPASAATLLAQYRAVAPR